MEYNYNSFLYASLLIVMSLSILGQFHLIIIFFIGHIFLPFCMYSGLYLGYLCMTGC